MVNIAGIFDGQRFRLLLFPRKKHRPAAFFRQGEGRVVVSPAVMEMAGIIVTPREEDFMTLDAPAVEAIYREVSLARPPDDE